MKVVYMADNGKIFETESACKAYEKQIDEMKSYRKVLLEFAEKCKDMDCNDCPFTFGIKRKCGFEIEPFNWEL